MTPRLLCPLCGGTLVECGQALLCPSGHSYDIAASGYCNLLRPGKQRNRVAGDDREMVSSRGRFLAAGYYEPALGYIVKTVAEHTPEDGVMVDAGCGEGYYTNGTALALRGLRVLGFDVSKYAADAASRGARRAGISDRVRYITAASTDIPVADGAADIVLSLFSPCVYGEFARVTAADGYLLVGSAGVSHLRELKAVLYGEENIRPNVPIDHPSLAREAGYELISRESVAFEAEITEKEHIEALFSMTPYRWRSPRDGAEALLRLETITVTVDFDFTLLRLNHKT